MTIHNHIKFFLRYGILVNIPYFIPIIILYFTGYLTSKVSLLLVFLIALVVLSSVLYIHLKYYYINKSTSINNSAILFNGIKFHFEDLKKVIINKSKNTDSIDGSLRFKYLPFEEYYYLKLETKDDQTIILTCLLDRKIDEKIKVLCPNILFVRNAEVFSPFPDW